MGLVVIFNVCCCLFVCVYVSLHVYIG